MYFTKKILFTLLFFSFSVAARVPNEAYTFDVHLTFTNDEEECLDKIDEATFLLKKVIQTDEFKKQIIFHRYGGKRTFSFNSGLSNVQIYKTILAGAEKLNSFENNTLDAEIDFFHKHDSNVIGFTKRNTHKIWINKKYFYKFNPAQLAGHLMHEWLHKLGFSHEVERTSRRKYSVPYSVGKIVKKLSTEIMNSSNLNGL